jgi:hypothetical protein
MSYKVTLTRDEFNSLAWCSARYESARILFDSMATPEDDEFPCEFRIPESVAWNARDAIAGDGGDAYEDGGFIPCLDSPAIRALFESIV